MIQGQLVSIRVVCAVIMILVGVVTVTSIVMSPAALGRDRDV